MSDTMMIPNSRGMSLIEVLVVVGIVSLSAIALATLMESGRRTNQGIEQKLEAISVQQNVLRDLGDAAICSCNFDPARNTGNGSSLTLDSTDLSNAVVNLNRLYSTCVNNVPGTPIAEVNQPLAVGSGIRVQSIRLAGIQPTGTGRYRGEIQIAFFTGDGQVARRPAAAALSFTLDTSVPTAARITACSTSNNLGGGGGEFTCPASSQSLCRLGPMVPSTCRTGNLPVSPMGAVFSLQVIGSTGTPQYQVGYGPAACDFEQVTCAPDAAAINQGGTFAVQWRKSQGSCPEPPGPNDSGSP